MPDEDSRNSLKQGSDDVINGFRQLASGSKQISISVASWFDSHPILKWIIITPVSAFVGNLAIQLISAVHAYFYQATVPISRDV